MRTVSIALAITALLAAFPVVHAETLTERGEQRLTRMLGDRTPDAPVDCFELTSGTKMIVIEGVGVVYDSQDVIYVGRPTNRLDPRDTVVLGALRGGNVCASQRFYTVSRFGAGTTGYADIREFIPYPRER